MTVKEYREKNPNCRYCLHGTRGSDYCSATEKRKSKRTAKRCPCYIPEKWYLDKEVDEVVSTFRSKM